jgi:DNA-binding NtrC family response regulator
MKRRILLVDDELAILLTLKAVLEMNDFEVETASSAREARTKLRASTFHMVITDMRMENESAGLDVVRAAKHGRDAGQADEHHESSAPDRGVARHPRR